MTLSPRSAAQTAPRTGDDHCPGVFATHAAADGPLARIRLPGGALTAEQLQALARAAADHGDGHLELTGRANVQLRAIRDVGAVAALIADAGLVADAATDRQRNVVVSALSGRVGGVDDVREVARRLDDALRGGAAPGGLSRRFWFGVDDGRGDVIAQRPDVTLVATGEQRFDVVFGDEHVGSTDAAGAVDVLLGVATHFVSAAPDAWRVSEVDARLVAAMRAHLGTSLAPAFHTAAPAPAPRTPVVGWFDQDDGRVLLGATVALGRLPARTAEFLAAIGAPLVITPHREILICDLTEGVAETVVRVLAPMGLIFDAASPWTSVSSCAGMPGCAKALAPVRDDLVAYVATVAPGEIGTAQHWVGCSRGCGTPTHAHVRVEAISDASGATEYRRTPMS
ncbi:precorrin-3B synthase [Gordonia sp. TBRC 11910]|uniref:Precorrin-3B synthase n=1 Tax=Gordonia asplenii TaxID=2725283 RepID=A0A848KPR1_9ACTN|nr:precorrin-3B synthase [Gordonia asplenii]NMO00009.1 precorrin-3B synthase [Gordonia asplenii]